MIATSSLEEIRKAVFGKKSWLKSSVEGSAEENIAVLNCDDPAKLASACQTLKKAGYSVTHLSAASPGGWIGGSVQHTVVMQKD